MEIISNEIHDTDNVYHDLFDGGYLKPNTYLSGDDLQEVESAIKVIKQFISTLEEYDLINYI